MLRSPVSTMQHLPGVLYNKLSQINALHILGTHSPQPPPVQKSLGVLLEQALEEAPALLIGQGKAVAALQRFRANLCAVESHGVNAVRLKFMCQMAELLLQGVAGDEYKPPSSTPTKGSIWKPSQYASLNQVYCDCSYY